MEKKLEDYGLNLLCTMILEEYRDQQPMYKDLEKVVKRILNACLKKNGLLVTALETRIKTEESLAGKLRLKGYKYSSLTDLTDILGARVITFYTDDVDKIAALVENTFKVDWDNSVDKRKMHELDSFGYMSLHFICSIPESVYRNPEYPELNDVRFEIQIRTALQHVWANLNHDTGYKSGVEAPREYMRQMNCLAGMLELADAEFSRLRAEITEYRRKMDTLVSMGEYSKIPLDGDTFRSYVAVGPFDALTRKIAAINHAEIHEAPLDQYFNVFKYLKFQTLGDIHDMIKRYSEDAYQFALKQIGGTDLDIISSTVGVQDLCIVFILENGGTTNELTAFLDALEGPSAYHTDRAARIMQQASQLPFFKKK